MRRRHGCELDELADLDGPDIAAARRERYGDEWENMPGPPATVPPPVFDGMAHRVQRDATAGTNLAAAAAAAGGVPFNPGSATVRYDWPDGSALFVPSMPGVMAWRRAAAE